MKPFTELFPEEDYKAITEWYPTYEPVALKLRLRQLPPKKVKTVFYGDSITHHCPIEEFFPGASFKNRGIAGDTLAGLYFRTEVDLYPFEPEQVVLLAGINGIVEENDRMMAKYEVIGDEIASRGIKLYYCSVLPMRRQCPRFQYMDKVRDLNGRLQELALRKYAGFIDYFPAMLDDAGELAEAYARPDGLHISLAGYEVMARVLKEQISLY